MRLKPEIRKKQILQKTVELARNKCYLNITRLQIARALGIAPTLINYYFNSMDDLRREILSHAITNAEIQIIRQASAHNDPILYNMVETLNKQR